MTLDPSRMRRTREALEALGLDGVASPYASEILLLTGYWPVMNASVAVSTRSGQTIVIVPEDEVELARGSTDAEIIGYHATTLRSIRSNMQGFTEPLLRAMDRLGLTRGRLGLLCRENIEPVSYIVGAQYRGSFQQLFAEQVPALEIVPVDDAMEQWKSVKVPGELAQMRLAARIAAPPFQAVPKLLRPGLREAEVAGELQRLFEAVPEASQAQRSYGYFFCMSGPNAALASAAFAHTRQRVLAEGDLVMIHANTCCDGYWTDITRTYTVGEAEPRHHAMRAAIAEARTSALAAIHPGVPARQVDAAARRVMEQHGLGQAFRHATGHGVGFAAANSGSLPRIHPASDDILVEGMTFNVEPAAYFDGYGGMRHCDVVAVTATGAEVLTDF